MSEVEEYKCPQCGAKIKIRIDVEKPQTPAENFVKDLFRTIPEIKNNVGKITDFKGEITAVLPFKEGDTKDGRKWKLQDIMLKDGSGEEIRVQFWNEDADRVSNCKVGEYLTLKNYLILEYQGLAYLKSAGSKKGSQILYSKPMQNKL